MSGYMVASYAAISVRCEVHRVEYVKGIDSVYMVKSREFLGYLVRRV